MLAEKPIDVILLAPNLEESRDFYADKLGLEVITEDEHTVTFLCGGDSRLVVSSSTTGTADPQMQASWRVDDLASELAELRSRGGGRTGVRHPRNQDGERDLRQRRRTPRMDRRPGQEHPRNRRAQMMRGLRYSALRAAAGLCSVEAAAWRAW
jgi:catechol 2,3-dioxygenase-like lactoylglutathione lyase family enzyme